MPGCAPGAGWLAWGLDRDDSEVPLVMQSLRQDAAEAGMGSSPIPALPPTAWLLSSSLEH